ncbi:MAG: tetratricopeptide repeat protein, partial [Cyanobacteria bacterium P01_A01_bin.68]
QEEVDRIIGITFENTINLINLNAAILSILVAVGGLLIVLIPFMIWWNRTSLKTYLERELGESLKKEIEEYKTVIFENKKEIDRLTTENTQRISKAEIMVNNFESKIDDAQSKLAKVELSFNDIKKETERITIELREQLQESIKTSVDNFLPLFESKMEVFQQKLNALSSDFENQIISTAEKTKDELVQQISELTPPLASIPDTNQPDIQQKIQQLTKQLEELKNKNPQLFFTTDDYLKQGDAFFYEERYEDAIIAYNKVIERKRHSYTAWVNRGWALRRLERYEEALSSYDEAIRIKPDEYIGWYGKANVLRELNKYEESIIAYDKSLELNPKFEWAWYRNAICYLLKHDNRKALENLSKAIELNSEKMHQNVKMDKDWDVIRDSEEFKKLIEE